MTATITIDGSSHVVSTWDEAWLLYDLKRENDPDIGEAWESGNKLKAYLNSGGWTVIAVVDPNPKTVVSISQPQYFEQDDIIGDAIKQQLEFFGFNSAPGVSNDAASSKLWFLVFLILGGAFIALRKHN